MKKTVLIMIFTLQAIFLFAQGFQIKYGLYNQSNQFTDTSKILFSDSTNFRIDWLNDERPYSLIILHNDTFITLFRNKKVYFVEKHKEINKGKDRIKIVYENRDSVISGYKVSYARVFQNVNDDKIKEYEIWYVPDKNFNPINAGTPFSNIPGLIFLRKDKEKQITEKVISISLIDLPLDLFKIPNGYKYFKSIKM